MAPSELNAYWQEARAKARSKTVWLFSICSILLIIAVAMGCWAK